MGETVRKTMKYKLKPTPEQARQLEAVVWHARALYNVALEQRKTWWQRGQGKGATYYQQKAELPDLRARLPGIWLRSMRRSCKMSCCGLIVPFRRSFAV